MIQPPEPLENADSVSVMVEEIGALAFLDLALLRIVADQTHEFDQLSHFGSIVIDHGGLLDTIVPHNPPPARLQPRQFTPIHAEFMGQTRRNERRCRVRFRVFADDIGRSRRAGYVGWRGNLARD